MLVRPGEHAEEDSRGELPDDGVHMVPDGSVTGTLPSGGIGVLLPTYVGRCDAQAHQETFHHLLERLAEVRASRPGLHLTVWVAMQYGSGEYREALRRLRRMTALGAQDETLTVVGVALPGPGKIRTLNTVLRLTAGLGYAGWLWTDDDIEIDPGCLARLVSRFHERGCRGAVGASPVILPRDSVAARTMGRIGTVTAPPNAYPAAACVMVATDVVRAGIPVRRLTDDGFVLFELLDADAPDPLHDLEVVPDATISFYRVSRTHDTLQRLRRSLYSHVTCVADYPWPVARVYLTRVLFYGLWPLAPWDGSRGPVRGVKRWAVKALHFTWFCRVAAELAVRGMARRPLRHVSWGDEGDFRSPTVAEPAAGAPAGA
ncbi:glycosyltransferase family 2 protein [Streptomyces sp. NPDC052043]|uniref:glycosyltransferase family 2 protein n=1 Tax=Streptomyces sp. NPDC052043 TaxID=3365684 RepID=UPI0037D509D0